MYNKRLIGTFYEDMAVAHLKNSGYIIVERNFYCKQGEIDIIAKENNYLVFVEVKYRKNNATGTPKEAVSYRKRKNIIKVAKYYIYKKKYSINIPIRFDVVSIEGEKIEIVRDAFWVNSWG